MSSLTVDPNLMIVLIADASESAAPFWAQTARTVADLIAELSVDSVSSVRLLGTSLRWEPDEWHPGMLMPPQARNSGSFAAPVMSALDKARENPPVIVIVGTGEVFDLADWLGSGVSWALVRVGSVSLQGASSRVLELTPGSLGALDHLLRTAMPAAPSTRPPPGSGFIRHEWTTDRAGYPMVRVEPINAFVHLFPLAKPQFEQFLADARLPGHGDAWYADLLSLNPRLSPMSDSLTDYERLFVTGLLPEDAQAYVNWHGGGLRPFTIREWRRAFRWMYQQDVSALPHELEVTLTPTAHRLWDGLRSELQPRTLLDLSLMRGGVVEWVNDAGRRWVGLGKPRNSFFQNLHHPLLDEFVPTSEAWRSRIWGLRLMRPC
ncbi:MAG: hypothetical protein H8E35_13325 [Ardenticatenia bacterium]|nr:hypothetical protein [Ardenticatenia bacterium]